MKKIFTSFFLIISLLSFTYSINVYQNIYNFNHISVKNNINYLSSEYFKGRLAGTTENYEVTAFIKTEFQKLDLIPFNGDYYDPFDVNYPNRLDENPYLKIIDKKGALVKQYKYGIDYKEEMLNFKKNHLDFSSKDSIKQSENVIQVTKGTDSFIFFTPSDNKLSFRSSFVNSNPQVQSMYIMLTKEALKDISKNISKGYKVSCFIPFDIRSTTINNVVGYIKGKNASAAPIIVSAHFDHVGSDLSGTVYNGALDNASGISFMLEFSKYIKSLGIPERTIMFIGFNAEEFGCLGSEHFAQKYASLLKGAKVYNFDMIGSSSVPLSIMGGKSDNDKTVFLRSVMSTCINEKVDYNFIFEDSSDHEAFRKNNIDALSFCDSDMSRIHTPEDKINFIDNEAIDRCFKVASKEVIKNAFGSNPMLLHYKDIMIFSGIGIVLFSVLYLINAKKNL
ncbi:Zn-dependent exopeptidase M28 [Clostridium sp. YIM B02515]|uniref:Zn-dependent exopeptidase M28 n=1 Tax=Clostridium rhizosphaerae TaxID=2803861 RepID=A0ABS1T8U9_9CLOT|nr:M28 family metallopeptidase [Clostridium rhizosphaerae]MBL4935769.1 Zn-dependent exopeptidase M28 [Clostridium rhizosphaerae]